MGDNDALRRFLARLIGWTRHRDVDQALRSLDVAATHRAHLVLCGTGDLVPIAYALHRRTLGADRPFVVCDPRRGNRPASARSPANCDSGIAALAAAAGGSLCVRRARLPDDFSSLVPRLRAALDVQYVVCSTPGEEINPLSSSPLRSGSRPSRLASGSCRGSSRSTPPTPSPRWGPARRTSPIAIGPGCSSTAPRRCRRSRRARCGSWRSVLRRT